MALESGFASSPPRRRRPVIPTTSPLPSTAWHVVGRAARHGYTRVCVRAWVHQWIYTTRAVTANGSRKTEGWSRNVARMGRRQLRSVPALSLENARPGRPSQRDLPKSTCIQALCGETPFSNAVINFFKKMFQLFRLKGRAPGAPRTARWSFILRPVSVRTFPTTLGERLVRVKFKTTRPRGSRRRGKADLDTRDAGRTSCGQARGPETGLTSPGMRRGPRGFSDRGADASLRDPPGEKRLEPAPGEAARETGNGSGPGEGRQQHRGLQTGGRVAFGLRVALQFPKKKKKKN